MSFLKKILFSAFVAQSAFLAIDAAEKWPTKRSTQKKLIPMPTIFEIDEKSAFSIRGCKRTFYANPEQGAKALKAIEQSEDKKWLTPCDCPGTEAFHTEFYHVGCRSCVDLGNNLVMSIFFKKRGTCPEQLNAYMRQLERKPNGTEQKN
ncbi:hypothetical protein JST99_00100 [Candidatus Dependentiae bacterium]|nr:hypothetical protein [Candidatus Dependentiae bacterium]MCC7414599.1 hypothetical protein [Campylobacterota bacterium]